MTKHKKLPKQAELIHGRREPISVEKVPGKREPKIAEQVDFMQMKAAWRVHKLQMVDPYGWHVLELETVGYIQSKLASFETMTWSEIFIRDRSRNHSIPVHKLRCPQAKRWIAKNMPDQPDLWTLRLSGPERIWGIFAEGAYQIIFWDPEHLIYPTQL